MDWYKIWHCHSVIFEKICFHRIASRFWNTLLMKRKLCGWCICVSKNFWFKLTTKLLIQIFFLYLKVGNHLYTNILALYFYCLYSIVHWYCKKSEILLYTCTKISKHTLVVQTKPDIKIYLKSKLRHFSTLHRILFITESILYCLL